MVEFSDYTINAYLKTLGLGFWKRFWVRRFGIVSPSAYSAWVGSQRAKKQ